MRPWGQIILALGAAIVTYGAWEWRNNVGPNAEPVSVDLAKIEAGQDPGTTFWKIGPHVRYYGLTGHVYTKDWIFRENEITQYYLYPIVSLEHPYHTANSTIAEARGELGRIAPKLSQFAVVVKADPLAERPPAPRAFRYDWMQGMILGRASDLEPLAKEYLQEKYPELNLSQVWLLEVGREPSRAPRRLVIFGLGIVMCIAGVLMWGKEKPSYEEDGEIARES